jgi:hypothetical protein
MKNEIKDINEAGEKHSLIGKKEIIVLTEQNTYQLP